jgi:PTS system nitrogen regulatory IIA component
MRPIDTGLDRLLTGFDQYPPVLTSSEVAELLTMSIQEVRRLTREGHLPARKIGKAYRYFRDEIVAWLDTQVPS